MTVQNKKILRWLKVFLILYAGIGIALFYLQEFFLFHPKKLDAHHAFAFKGPYKELLIPYANEDSISLVKFLPNDSVPRGLVLYFHGNMENVERYARFVSDFTKHGFEVWMEDYPGFGKSRGKITEDKLYDQALYIGKMARRKFADSNIIVYGKSFGTGIAAYTATTFTPQQLILETPYYSIPDLFSSFAPIYPASQMSKYSIPTYRFIDGLPCPVTIFQGTNDAITRYSHAKKLKPYLKQHDRFIVIEKGTHHNLAEFTSYRQALDSLLK